MELLAVHQDLAPGGPVAPGEDVEQPVLALALERRHAEDLTGGHLEETPVACRSMRRSRTTSREVRSTLALAPARSRATSRTPALVDRSHICHM